MFVARPTVTVVKRNGEVFRCVRCKKRSKHAGSAIYLGCDIPGCYLSYLCLCEECTDDLEKAKQHDWLDDNRKAHFKMHYEELQ